MVGWATVHAIVRAAIPFAQNSMAAATLPASARPAFPKAFTVGCLTLSARIVDG
jgi:hypothetical protein